MPLRVTLRTFFSSIVDVGRGRVFSRDERARIWVMIVEGYDSRPFSNLVLDMGKAGFAGTLARLEHEARRMIAG